MSNLLRGARLAVMCLCASKLAAQAPSPPSDATATKMPSEVSTSQLSPDAAYQSVMLPVEVTRASISNWSQTEQAALGVAIQQAAAACGARRIDDFHGANLIGLARLCSLGLAWPTVVIAAQRYIQEPDLPKPLLSEAYADEVHADLNLHNESEALKSASSMIESQPYGITVAAASNEAIDYMELLFTADALAIARQRQSKILDLLRQATGPSSPGVGGEAPPSATDLYQQGLRLAELEEMAEDHNSSSEALTSLEAALPTYLGDDDRLRIAALRRRHDLLGHPLMELSPITSLRRPAVLPQIPARGAVTALLLFPDWCSQCIGLARQMPETVFTVTGHEAFVYGLLALTVAPTTPLHTPSKGTTATANAYDPSLAAQYLQETPTVTVPPRILEAFNVTAVPLLIVTDSQGIVRLIEPTDEAALQPGRTVDSAIAMVAKRWPDKNHAPRAQTQGTVSQSPR